MEEVQNEEAVQNEEVNSKKNGWFLPVGIILVIGIGLFFATRQKDNQVTPPTTTTLPLTEGSGSSNIESSPISVEGGMFFFKPNEIRVNKGQTVKIIFTNTEGKHDFVIDEFNVKSAKLEENESEEITFVADQAGEFQFYCSVTDHKAKGMVGKLIVEE